MTKEETKVWQNGYDRLVKFNQKIIEQKDSEIETLKNLLFQSQHEVKELKDLLRKK